MLQAPVSDRESQTVEQDSDGSRGRRGGTAEILPRYSRVTAEILPRYCRDTAEILLRDSRDMQLSDSPYAAEMHPR